MADYYMTFILTDSVMKKIDADEEDKEEMREEEDAEENELDLESVLAELEKDLDDEDQVDEMEDKDEEEAVDLRDKTPDIARLRRKLKYGFEDWRK